MKRLLPFLPIAALIAIVFAGFLALQRGDREDISASGLTGQVAPGFDLPSLDGGPAIRSAAFASRPHLLNFFASWCEGCIVEHPLLMQLQAEGALIVGVAYKDRPENTQRFLGRWGDPFKAVAIDFDGRTGLQYGLAGAPETFVIGADGRILAIHRGALTEDVIASIIRPALNLTELGAPPSAALPAPSAAAKSAPRSDNPAP
jgi:cytochrome c biogenesis protein CcmG/thiol:disulfide interchange protein DsbE